MGTFPFGCCVERRTPTADGPRQVFVLGAYPSAVHIRWKPPHGWRLVRALAVDNEPEPFWTGDDQDARLQSWKLEAGWQTEWGTVLPATGLNGPSGQWVERNVLQVLGVDRRGSWITDCLDTYRASVRMRTAIESVYQPFAERMGLPEASLPHHPTENQIVTEAQTHHRDRLLRELGTAQPERVVTLGNAALRVFRSLLDAPTGPTKLSARKGYGASVNCSVGGGKVEWWPVAHPASPEVFQQAHASWAAGQRPN